MTNEDADILNVLAGCDYLETFDSEALQEYLNYKWDEYGYRTHYLSAFMHFFCIITVALYINNIYCRYDDKLKP